jgi:hypothetical protein
MRDELALPSGHPVLEDLDTIQHAADTMHRLINGEGPVVTCVLLVAVAAAVL